MVVAVFVVAVFVVAVFVVAVSVVAVSVVAVFVVAMFVVAVNLAPDLIKILSSFHLFEFFESPPNPTAHNKTT